MSLSRKSNYRFSFGRVGNYSAADSRAWEDPDDARRAEFLNFIDPRVVHFTHFEEQFIIGFKQLGNRFTWTPARRKVADDLMRRPLSLKPCTCNP